MNFESYSKCPICGQWHDDGSIIELDGHIYALCLDCTENYSDEEIIKKLKE